MLTRSKRKEIPNESVANSGGMAVKRARRTSSDSPSEMTRNVSSAKSTDKSQVLNGSTNEASLLAKLELETRIVDSVDSMNPVLPASPDPSGVSVDEEQLTSIASFPLSPASDNDEFYSASEDPDVSSADVNDTSDIPLIPISVPDAAKFSSLLRNPPPKPSLHKQHWPMDPNEDLSNFSVFRVSSCEKSNFAYYKATVTADFSTPIDITSSPPSTSALSSSSTSTQVPGSASLNTLSLEDVLNDSVVDENEQEEPLIVDGPTQENVNDPSSVCSSSNNSGNFWTDRYNHIPIGGYRRRNSMSLQQQASSDRKSNPTTNGLKKRSVVTGKALQMVATGVLLGDFLF